MNVPDPDEYLRQFDPRLLSTPEGRRSICQYDPLAFGLIYFRDSLRSPETGNKLSLSHFHMDVTEAAKRWAKSALEPLEIREAWVAPRGSGKSTWMFLILPAWALAYNHRRYVMAFADNASQAQAHLATFKRKVQTENVLLRRDFPDLCRPKMRPGGMTDSDRQNLYLAKSGATFQASGIDSTTLGAKIGDRRPDLLLFDDIEPPADQYSAAQKEGRLSTIRDAIFPMNLYAVVELVGTVTMDGSIMHDIVRQEIESEYTSPEWVRSEHIKTRYYPALYEEDDGTETSIWPQMWTTEFLQSLRKDSPRSFAMNYMNKPVPLNSAYWSEDMFRHDNLVGCTKHIISIDPAVTTNRNSDYTGIAVLSWSDSEQKVLLRHADRVKLPPNELRLHVMKLVERFGSRMLLVESNQGGDTWHAVFHNFPIPIQTLHNKGKKELRWAEVLDLWPQRRVLHAPDGETAKFETEALLVPKSAHDDVVDAVTSGVRYCFRTFAGRSRKPQRERVLSYVSYL